ncbi:MAG: glycerate kinase [Verrucomicrobia bacterium]|nr:glycerate kinase [Verrucomicrobiota bacterium]
MKVAIAPDSFKGSMTAMQAAVQIESGLKRALSGVSCRKIPMADGGEGTVQAIVDATGGKFLKRTVSDPLGRRIKATFGLSGDGTTAVMEMAEANGLALLKPRERNPMKTSTYGTGELMKHALKLGVRKILIGIGGSATNDGGTGMAEALGARFLDAKGKPLSGCGGNLGKIATIDMSGLDPRLKNVHVEVACDVDNPLTGRHGAAQVYGPQKGASPTMVKQLDAGLKSLAGVIKRDIGISILKAPGSGAAGGLGGGLMAFVGGQLRPGVDIVIDSVKLARRIKGCDLVITGEGRMDHQTAFGKTPAGVARVAKEQGLPVMAICGCLGKDPQIVNTIGIDAFFASQENNIREEDLPKIAPRNLANCAEQLGRLLAIDLGKPPKLRKR